MIFSIDMKSKKHVRNISISDETRDHVLFQGDLGPIDIVSIIDSTALEVIGSNGILRLEICEDILEQVFTSTNRKLRLNSKSGETPRKVGKIDNETYS